MNLPVAAPKLLVVDDEPDLRTLYELTLMREGYDVESAGTVSEGWAALQASSYDLLITDMRLPDGTGLELLSRLEAAGRPEKAMVITAYGSPENAVEALKAGAYDYLTKPVDLRQFRAVVASALGRQVPVSGSATQAAGIKAPRREVGAAASRRDVDSIASTSASLERLAGDSGAMRDVRSMVQKVARSMAPVLVHGESGTGKELVARAIHDVSSRASMAFVAVNCGAIPEHLLESEFFGYRKGAFTGAQEDRGGFFQAAQGGTLFLDEIGDLPLAMQSKLLRVIQERAVRPIGSVVETPLDVRIVSATHKDLGLEVREGRFRQDLFYRLNVIRIGLPPLRERMVDLPEICRAVLSRIARDAGVAPEPRVTEPAIQRLMSYPFPGNVRELENVLHRALALSGSELIDVSDLGLAHDDGASPVVLGQPEPSPEPTLTSDAALPSDLQAYLDDVERQILLRALERHRYNRTAAGARLGLSLRQMRYRMARLGVDTGGQAPD
jgi:two-component system response regulator PilR (NtrC family)